MASEGFMLPPAYEGVTWDGIHLITLTNRQTDRPLNLKNAEVSMTYRRVGERRLGLSLGVGAGITIVSAIEGKLRVEPQLLPLLAGQYYFELIVKLASGIKLPPILLGTQEITRLGVQS